MVFLLHIAHIIIFLLAIIFSCTLFTNAIEHLGDKLKFSTNATGSILAVIGTTLPETIVPVVAIASAYFLGHDFKIQEEVALGAIMGSPFMLSCLGLFLLGVVLIFKKRTALKLDYKNVLRDFKYFLLTYPVAICAFFAPLRSFKIFVAIYVIFVYLFFVYRTIIKPKDNCLVCNTDDLIFSKILSRYGFCTLSLIIFQAIVSILAMIVFAHLFTHEIVWFSNTLNISPFVASLVVTPFATELPECVNSILWLKDDKDELAIANVLGAVVFQGSLLAGLGILLTSWTLNGLILANALVLLSSSGIFLLQFIFKKEITRTSLILAGIFYFVFFIMTLT